MISPTIECTPILFQSAPDTEAGRNAGGDPAIVRCHTHVSIRSRH